jgi:hypothetical protein
MLYNCRQMYNYSRMFMRAYDFSAPHASLYQRRPFGDVGRPFRPGDFCHAPEDREAPLSGTA